MGLIGEFSTPEEGALVSGSIAVTGWALDDMGVESVKIYREVGKKDPLVYIGDAIFIDGTRPDIEAAYPDYPFNYRAGWGYLLLTNNLPNGGNGEFTLHAVATNIDGHSLSLGTKTITLDNSGSVKPFGAIDTPSVGSTTSGSNYINWGWSLTPQPNNIPIDGSTIHVWVDGINLGHPNYNVNRTDVAALFPNYANSTGAGGYFYLDTTNFTEGLHTIQWSVTDDAGNTDGIGSRYFFIERDAADYSAATVADKPFEGMMESDLLSKIPVNSSPILLKLGYSKTKARMVHADQMGIHRIEADELELIEINLQELFPIAHKIEGYLTTNGRLQALPVGSTLDGQRGVFHWQLAAGFNGTYRLVFILRDETGQLTRKEIIVTIGFPWTPVPTIKLTE